uniref:Strictosidine synthase conserved region domain-containing protein n=2 Tax=Zea mays TaxID=4577 RepID=A0A804MUY6_MAIZE
MMHPNNGSWERWRFVGGTGLLGVAPSADGTMLVCDADKGLLRVGDEGVTLLASEVESSPIRFADAAIEASDGTVYFSDASTRYVLDDSQGKVINFVTSVTEFNGDIFLGSLATNFVAKLSLARVAQEQGAVSS